MSALDPSGPSQPTLEQAYTTPGNPATKQPSEQAQATSNADSTAPPIDKRVPSSQAPTDTEGQAKAPGGGIHGAPAGEESKGLTQEDVGRHKELDGEQMAMPGEGRVADAVAGNKEFGAGGGGSEQDFAGDLERKKEEQRGLREEIKGKRGEGWSEGGEKGQTGGPANPVGGKGNYPNSGV